MPKTKAQKEEIVQSLADKFQKMKSVVFTHFFGLTVKDVEELRAKCREVNVEYLVAKKTLLDVALKKSGVGVDINPREFEGEVATVISYADEVSGAKTLAAFARKHDQVKFVGGVLEGKFLDAASVKRLSAIPSRQELLAQLVGSINAPISGFVNVLAGNLRGLVQVLSAIQKSKQ